MGPVVSLVKEGVNPSYDRCYDVAQHLRRVHHVLKEISFTQYTYERIISILKSLYENNNLLIRKKNDHSFEVLYLPSAQANLSVFKSGDTNQWPINIHNRQKKIFRVTKGAIFKCPVENEINFLEVFTTDWAPCASACAVAIHSQHPFVDHPRDIDDYFTGKFVRHPLTGDLIPVHVAKWVKPNFGTGAVLVNPGHDETDLKYARQIGLPIRFSLAPESFDGTPLTWLSVPVKIGNSTKTGFYDGKSQNELVPLYFEKLKAFDLAEHHYDYQAGMWPICRLSSSDSGVICINSSLQLSFSNQNNGDQRYTIEPLNILIALASIKNYSSPIIVTPASEIEKELLVLRLAYYDVIGGPLIPDRIEIVQKVNESELKHNKYFRQAALVGSKASEVSTPKKQLIEHVERFNLQHEIFTQVKSRDLEEIQPTKLWKLAVRTLQSLHSDGFSRAFSNLYKLQKELRQVAFERLPYEPGFHAYLVITYIIMGIGDLNHDFNSLKVYKHLMG